MRPRLLLVVALVAVACSARDPEGLGPHYQEYLRALSANRTEEAVRHLYAAYLDALRSKDPARAMRFFRPDMHPEERNALRMGLEFVKILERVDGRITDLRDLVNRVRLVTSETASFRFRDKSHPDVRTRVYQLTRVDGHWYFDPPDLGKARKKK